MLHRVAELPGQELFEYIDDDGEVQAVGSGDVNEYLREATGEDITAKDFRTWAGTVLAFDALRTLPPASTPTEAKSNVVAAVRTVAERLGNTPAVSRSSYIHPGVVDAYMDGKLRPADAARSRQGPVQPAPQDEAAVLRLLRRRSARAL